MTCAWRAARWANTDSVLLGARVKAGSVAIEDDSIVVGNGKLYIDLKYDSGTMKFSRQKDNAPR